MVASREIARSANKMKRLQTQVHGSLGSRRNQGKLTGEVYQVLDGSFRLLTEEYDAMNHLTREAHQNIEAHKRKLSAVFSRLALSMALHVRRRSICMCALDRWRKFNYESIIGTSQKRDLPHPAVPSLQKAIIIHPLLAGCTVEFLLLLFQAHGRAPNTPYPSR